MSEFVFFLIIYVLIGYGIGLLMCRHPNVDLSEITMPGAVSAFVIFLWPLMWVLGVIRAKK